MNQFYQKISDEDPDKEGYYDTSFGRAFYTNKQWYYEQLKDSEWESIKFIPDFWYRPTPIEEWMVEFVEFIRKNDKQGDFTKTHTELKTEFLKTKNYVKK